MSLQSGEPIKAKMKCQMEVHEEGRIYVVNFVPNFSRVEFEGLADYQKMVEISLRLGNGSGFRVKIDKDGLGFIALAISKDAMGDDVEELAHLLKKNSVVDLGEFPSKFLTYKQYQQMMRGEPITY